MDAFNLKRAFLSPTSVPDSDAISTVSASSHATSKKIRIYGEFSDDESDSEDDWKKCDQHELEDAKTRNWSKSLSDSDTSTIYTFTVYFGDPTANIPSFFKTMKKENLKYHLIKGGYKADDPELRGKKDHLLYLMFRDLPRITFQVDSRECLQVILALALHHFDYDDSHLFTAKMPRRGDKPMGSVKYKNHRDFKDRYFLQRFSSNPEVFDPKLITGPHMSTEDWIQAEERRMKFSRGVNMPEKYYRAWRALLRGEISWNSPHYERQVVGSAFKPNKGGALSLNYLSLQPDDTIHFSYDYGSPSTIIAHVDSVERNKPVLPELNVTEGSKYVGGLRARAAVLRSARLKNIPPQYDRSDNYYTNEELEDMSERYPIIEGSD